MDPSIYAETVVIRVFSEFSSVLFQLVCFSRLGANDYYYVAPTGNVTRSTEAVYRNSHEPSLAANLVLFVTLVLFNFPFMNGYILFMYDTCVLGRTTTWRVLMCFVLVGCQLLGVLAAHAFIHRAQEEQQTWQGTITWIVPKGGANNTGRNIGVELFEELVAVTALLVGYVHVTYYNFGETGLFQSTTHTFSKFTLEKKLPVQLPFILHMTLLVAGLLRAFPTAHLSPHVSLYILLMGYTTPEAFGCRIGGGCLGFLVAYALFWGPYIRRTGVREAADLCRRPPPDYVYTVGLAQDAGEALLAPYPLRRSDTMASAGREESVHSSRGVGTAPQAQTISFNNAYRHVYRAI